MNQPLSSPTSRIPPAAAYTGIGALLATTLILGSLGRRWWCACEASWLVTGEAFSPHTSQHLLDPYSVTHVLHGFVFWWLVRYVCGGIPPTWRFTTIVLIEAAWEVLENTPWVIARYREATAALGYEGDTIFNSLADIACCWTGAWLANRLGFRRSLAVFLVTELFLAWWIRDNLTLNVAMLLWPSETLTQWQTGR